MLSRSNLACFFFHHTGEMSLSCFGLLWHRDLAANGGRVGDGSRTILVYSNWMDRELSSFTAIGTL
ncbi:hypothetical protein [Microcoleus sp. FACHB-672]|uniref:hypothetical protein n=1 Tax=Microcoleus sp. FACHB-672 TaxID=2692825 RepID=UPI00168A305E|nr:hypothetical protein [Microcoleus sp. FACHB-672]MBD2044011.1 hypothetical protein [Microcoleus sp. FACHB-672]